MGRVLIHVLVGATGGVIVWSCTLLLGAIMQFVTSLDWSPYLTTLGILVAAGAAFGWTASR